jgi:hypothetical protein
MFRPQPDANAMQKVPDNTHDRLSRMVAILAPELEEFSSRIRSLITPDLLDWARTRSEAFDAAISQVDPDTLRRYEAAKRLLDDFLKITRQAAS